VGQTVTAWKRGFCLTLSTRERTSGAKKRPQHLHQSGIGCAYGHYLLRFTEGGDSRTGEHGPPLRAESLVVDGAKLLLQVRRVFHEFVLELKRPAA